MTLFFAAAFLTSPPDLEALGDEVVVSLLGAVFSLPALAWARVVGAMLFTVRQETFV